MTHVNPCDKADETPPSYDEATEPGATTVPAAAIAPGTLKYTAVATCQSCAYLLRSDGTVDRSVFGGRVATQMVRKLRHHFRPSRTHSPALYCPTRAVFCPLLSDHAGRVLIGAWNPML